MTNRHSMPDFMSSAFGINKEDLEKTIHATEQDDIESIKITITLNFNTDESRKKAAAAILKNGKLKVRIDRSALDD